ncbi:MAG: hypothetical protein ASARMPRED_005495 [Alectoria sarmentosa]|nr:MAG: hypothetical protein ASARMPRED_005495 [Alectoria sarmentosa]
MEKFLYERYGNNEPYTEPEPESVVFWYAQETPAFLQPKTGPSTNFYVGPDRTHYTISKRLLYEFSAFAKSCLAGNFAEATANATWLPDVSPDVFQWIGKWLYQRQLHQIERYCHNLRKDEVDYPHIRTYVNPEE